MSEKDCKHFTDSIIYVMEQTSVYFRVKGSQIFNKLNIDITLDQFIALDAISYNEDICQRDLSKLILKDRSNTGRILTILEEKGFIERKVETKKNRLIKKIYITEKGKNLIVDNQPKIRDAFHCIFEDISEEEFATLRNLLNKMKNSLSKTTTLQI